MVTAPVEAEASVSPGKVKPIYGRTLVLIKPDAVRNHHIGEIITRLEKIGKIVGLRVFRFTKSLAREFYVEHAEKPWFKSLLTFMMSGPTVAIVIEGEDIQKQVRRLIGATNPKDAKHGTLRKKFGASGAANAVHGADSWESAAREIALLFKEEDLIT